MERNLPGNQKNCNFQNVKIFIHEVKGFKSFVISSFLASECHDIEKSLDQFVKLSYVDQIKLRSMKDPPEADYLDQNLVQDGFFLECGKKPLN